MTQTRNTVVITGASRGIGAALVKAYTAQGAKVIAVSRSLPATTLPNVVAFAADLGTDEGIAALTKATKAHGQPIDILINNAGVQNEIDLTGPADTVQIDAEIALNLVGPIKLSLALLPFLRAPGGSVVNVTSLVSLHPKPSAPVYSATKAGLASFTRALRHQLASKAITVIDVIPPLVATEMTAGRGSGKLSPEDMAEAIVTGIARGEMQIAPGKSKLVLRLNRLFPGLIARILSKE